MTLFNGLIRENRQDDFKQKKDSLNFLLYPFFVFLVMLLYLTKSTATKLKCLEGMLVT